MINRDYLRNLSNEKLAEFLKGSTICTCMMETCHDYDDCGKCIKKWLEMERNPKVERGQMRREPYQGNFWVILYVSEENGIHEWCLGLDEHGNVARLSVDVVRTWFLWDEEKEKNDDDVDKFLERLLNDLIEKD